MSPEHLMRRIEALQNLKESEGYEIFLEAVRNDLQKASEAMYKTEALTDQQLDFRRGACYATSNILTVVETLINYYRNQYILASAPREGGQSSSR